MAVRRRGGKNGLFGNLSPSTRRRLVEGDGEGPGTRWRFAFLYYNNPTARQKRRKIVQTVFLHHKAERLESPFADLKTPTTAMNDRAPLLLSEEQWPIALGSVARRDSSKTETMTRVVGLQRENARGAVEYVRRPQANSGDRSREERLRFTDVPGVINREYSPRRPPQIVFIAEDAVDIRYTPLAHDRAKPRDERYTRWPKYA